MFSITKENKMKKISSVIHGKYRKIKNPKISYTFETRKIVLSVICSKCKNEDEKIF